MKRNRILAALWIILVVAVPVSSQIEPESQALPLGLDAYRAIPLDNPLTPAKVALGRKLFFDPLLSRDGSRSCASCHRPEFAFTDGQPLSVGVFGRRGNRSVPTLINRTYGQSFFWDGRIQTLEEQVLQPILAADEMASSPEEVVQRLKERDDYVEAFRDVFSQSPSRDGLARALAAYVRTVLSGNAPIDRYLQGQPSALTKRQLRGLKVFRERANCRECHIGPNFTDEGFHNTGVAWQQGKFQDQGRFLVTGREKDQGAFKTPTLREISRTAPYMHDGSLETLADVIDFYDQGGRPNPNLDASIRPLNLSQEERGALEAFLKSLSGTTQEGVSVRLFPLSPSKTNATSRAGQITSGEMVDALGYNPNLRQPAPRRREGKEFAGAVEGQGCGAQRFSRVHIEVQHSVFRVESEHQPRCRKMKASVETESQPVPDHLPGIKRPLLGLLLQAYPVFGGLPESQGEQTEQSLRRLVDLYQSWGQPEEADR